RVADAQGIALRRWNRAVGHQRRMLDEALHTAEAFGQREQMAVLQKTFRPGKIGVQADRHHAAEGAHLSLGEFVLWMRDETWVMDVRDFGLLGEPAGKLERVGAVSLHA